MKNKGNKNLTNVIKIREWMTKTGGRRFPSSRSKDIEEKKLGHSLGYIRNYIVKPYFEMNDEERIKYKENYPEIEEIIDVMEQIDKSKITYRMVNIREIKKWMEKTKYINYPKASSHDREEASLGEKLSNIRSELIKPYKKIKTDSERQQYKLKNRDFEDVMKIMEEIDINIIRNLLENVKEINQWIEKNNFTNTLHATLKNSEERNMARRFESIKNKINTIYNRWTLEQQKRCVEQYPEVKEILMLIEKISNNKEGRYLKNARDILEWSKTKGEDRPPIITKYDEEERKWGEKLYSIRQELLRPYYKLETKEEREKYKKRRLDLEKIIKIVEEMDKNDIHPYLANAYNIKQWTEERGKLPRRSKGDEKETELAIQLKSIRYYVVKPYIDMKSDEKEKYRSEQKEMVKAIDIISELDEKYGNEKKKELARLIQEDLKKDKKLKDARELKAKYEEMLEREEDIQK